MSMDSIPTRVSHILETLPPGVTLVAAAKSRTPKEVEAAIREIGRASCRERV